MQRLLSYRKFLNIMKPTYLATGLAGMVLASAAVLGARNHYQAPSQGIEITIAQISQTQGVKQEKTYTLNDFYSLEKGVYDANGNPIELIPAKQQEGKSVRYNKLELMDDGQAGLVLHSPDFGIASLGLYNNGKEVLHEELNGSTELINKIFPLNQYGQGEYMVIAKKTNGQIITTNKVTQTTMNPNYFQKPQPQKS